MSLPQIPNRAQYIAGPETSLETARTMAKEKTLSEPVLLKRRGTALGWIAMQPNQAATDVDQTLHATWHASQPYVLPCHYSAQLPEHAASIEQSKQLMETIAQGESPADLFDAPPYIDQLHPHFEMLTATTDESDLQEIETIEFDAVDGDEIVGENLWCKASWLSYEDDDASLRFRFSFGIVGYEDVAADLNRQKLAGDLTNALFPESALITNDTSLKQQLCEALEIDELAYVERIVYFNAPNGGAQFHQDIEKGHLGVIFAQLRGSTGWLACSKGELMKEIESFVSNKDNQAVLETLLDEAALQQLKNKCLNQRELDLWLDDNENNAPVETLLNRCPEFYKHLCDCGYAYIIQPGDVILLPQKSLEECCWHTVFCINDYPGESLSFAIRALN